MTRERRWASRIVEASLGADAAEGALGDLEEEYLAGVPAGRLRWRDRLRYWLGVLSIGIHAVSRPPRRRRAANDGRRGLPWTGVGEDLRFTVRLVRRRPWTLGSAVASLALGIALCAVLFAVLHAAWIQAVPYPAADRLVSVQTSRAGRPDIRFGLSGADFVAWRDAADVFESFGAYVPFGSFDLTGDDEPIRLDRHLATAELFAALGTPALVGRTLLASDERPGAAPVAVLRHSLWQTRFGSDPRAVGRSIVLDGVPHTVVGVMPRGFGVRGGTPDLWTPLRFGEERPADRRTFYLVGIARLRDGVTLEQARSGLETVSRRVSVGLPEGQRDLVALTQPLREVMTAGLRPLLTLLLGAVLVVLTLVALNVANLLAALRLARREELAVRRALGASDYRLGRQTLVEGLAIAIVAGIGGTLVSLAAVNLLPDLRDTVLHRYVDVQVNFWVVRLSLALSLACGGVVGLLPGLAVPAGRLQGSDLRGGLRLAGGRVTRAVVVVQTALCALLLLVATATLHGVLELQATAVGYRYAETLAGELDLPRTRYPTGESATRFDRRALEEIRRLPQVRSAALASGHPGDGWSFSPNVRGRSEATGVSARFLLVSRGYFDTIGLTLREGRGFSEADRAEGPRVAVINRTAARQLFPDASPLGQSIDLDGPRTWYEIVGVVDDVVSDSSKPARAATYFLLDQALFDLSLDDAELRQRIVLVRSASADVHGLWADVRAAVRFVDPDLPLTPPSTLAERTERRLFRPRLSSGLLTLFGAIALSLSALGLYGVVALAVRLGGRDLAIRLALGARPRGLMARALGHGLLLTGIGAALGLIAAWLLRAQLTSVLSRGSLLEPMATLTAPILLLSIALVACWIPARRILTIDPARTLRGD